MLKNVELKPISGTFVNMLISDTGIVNAGLKEWEQDFKMMKAIGIDQLFIIRTECEQNGIRLSAEDPRSTTWPEDENLLDMAFRLGEKYDMSVYLGGPVLRTVPLSASELRYTMSLALLVFPAELARKIILRLSGKRGGY